MKDLLKHSVPLALVCAVIIAVLFTFIGINRTVASAGKAVEKAYSDHDSRYGSVKEDVSSMIANAENLRAIGQANGIDVSAMTAALEAIASVKASPVGFGDALDRLYSSASTVYQQIKVGSGADEGAKTSATLFFADIDSSRMIISQNKLYKSAAEKYNKVISSFPASLFAKGRKPAAVFG